jgi:hypothetical protein
MIHYMIARRGKNIRFITDNIGKDNGFTDAELRHVKKYLLYTSSHFKAYLNGKLLPPPYVM